MKYSAGSYHLRTTGRLWWCRPLARESRSTSRFATAPRFCSCCSSGAAPPLRRCLSGHDALLEGKNDRRDGIIREKEKKKRIQSSGGAAVITLIHTPTLPALVWVPVEYFSWVSVACSVSLSSENYQGEQTTNFLLNRSFITKASIPLLHMHIFCVILFEWHKVFFRGGFIDSQLFFLNLTDFLFTNLKGYYTLYFPLP